jgi:hypothetical protein
MTHDLEREAKILARHRALHLDQLRVHTLDPVQQRADQLDAGKATVVEPAERLGGREGHNVGHVGSSVKVASSVSAASVASTSSPAGGDTVLATAASTNGSAKPR